MGLLEDIIKGMTQGQGQQQGQQPQYPQQGNTTGQPSGDISIEDLERQMGIGTGRRTTTTGGYAQGGQPYQQQYPQQYPQQQYPQ